MQSQNTRNRVRKLLTCGVASLGLFMAVPGMALAGDRHDSRRDHRHSERCEHRSSWRSSDHRNHDSHRRDRDYRRDYDYRDSRSRSRDRRDDRFGFGIIVSEGRRGTTIGIGAVLGDRR